MSDVLDRFRDAELADCLRTKQITLYSPDVRDLLDQIDVLVEFGCADGYRLKRILPKAEGKLMIGFDTPLLIQLAQAGTSNGILFLDDWTMVKAIVRAEKQKGKRVGIVLSSPMTPGAETCGLTPGRSITLFPDCPFDVVVCRQSDPVV